MNQMAGSSSRRRKAALAVARVQRCWQLWRERCETRLWEKKLRENPQVRSFTSSRSRTHRWHGGSQSIRPSIALTRILIILGQADRPATDSVNHCITVNPYIQFLRHIQAEQLMAWPHTDVKADPCPPTLRPTDAGCVYPTLLTPALSLFDVYCYSPNVSDHQ